MDILIIGNGFDLAHKLDTKYTDFLKYCRDYNEENPISDSDEMNEEFLAFLKDNVWLSYFLKITPNLDTPKTWIDFEKEIAKIIHTFESTNTPIAERDYLNRPSETILRLESMTLEPFISLFSTNSIDRWDYVITNSKITDINSLKGFLYSQLQLFARAFEIYCLKINSTRTDKPIIKKELQESIAKQQSLVESYEGKIQYDPSYVGKKYACGSSQKFVGLREEATQILKTLIQSAKPVDYLGTSKFDCVLSFNYTNTYERLYGAGNENTKYCYIHGKAQSEAQKTNIIFGINDELSQGAESKDFRWVKFKKYYQRIIFKTGSEYKDWLDDISSMRQNYVHIVGHSLDETDHDVLYEFFSKDHLKIIVYYHCPDDFEDKVQKVIQLLDCTGGNGRDELIHRVHGEQWTIKFVDQYDENEGLFIRN